MEGLNNKLDKIKEIIGMLKKKHNSSAYSAEI